MTVPDAQNLHNIAEECVRLVAKQYGRQLDWSLDSLTELDLVCAALTEHGPLTGPRLDLWWKLIGAYTGETVIGLYGGEWVSHEKSPGAPAIRVLGMTGFPFSTTDRILGGEEFKSLASFARTLPAIAERSRRDS